MTDLTELTPPPPPEPQCGESLRLILAERQAELCILADRQRVWVAPAADDKHDLEQSASRDVRLTGAEAYFMAAHAVPGLEADVAALEEQTTRLRVADPDASAARIDMTSLTGRNGQRGGRTCRVGAAHDSELIARCLHERR